VKRAIKPRATEALSVSPIFVSDLTAAAVVGLEARAFRELIADLAVPHLRRGHRIIVDAEVLRAAIGAAARSEGGPVEREAPSEAAEGPAPVSGARLLARLGRERIAGGGR
jgi:hypothetical protein